jgi:Flp pilus assembly protein TadG
MKFMQAAIGAGRCCRRPFMSNCGQSLLEFAIIAPTVLLIAFGAVDLGRLFFTYESLMTAAREGALFGSFNPGATDNTLCAIVPNNCDPNNIYWHVKKQDTSFLGTTTLGITSAQIGVTCYLGTSSTVKTCATSSAGDTIEVTIGKSSPYTFTPITPIISNVVGSSVALQVKVRAGVY